MIEKEKIENPQCIAICEHPNFVKYGMVCGKQRYRCKECKKLFYLDPATFANRDKHRQALILYLEGVTIEKIGELLGKDRNTISRWLEKSELNLKFLQNLRKTKINKIETSYAAVSKEDDNKDDKDCKVYREDKERKYYTFRSGFVILEQEKRTYISFLKEQAQKNDVVFKPRKQRGGNYDN